MSRELLVVAAETPVNALPNGADNQMVRAAVRIEASSSIEAAARHLVREGTLHLVVVDGAGVAVGSVSVLDVLRAIVGVPVAPSQAALPHLEARPHSSWTEDWPLDEAHASRAPDVPGVLVLMRMVVDEPDAVVWVEACANVRQRIVTLTGLGSSGEPALARLLERHDLRFRAAAVHDDADRERVTSNLSHDLDHRRPPVAS